MKRLDFNKSPVLHFGLNPEQPTKVPKREGSLEFITMSSEAVSGGDFGAAVLGKDEIINVQGDDSILNIANRPLKQSPFEKIKHLHNWDDINLGLEDKW